MDADASIETGRLEKPEILVLMLRRANGILRTDDLIVLFLERMQFDVKLGVI